MSPQRDDPPVPSSSTGKIRRVTEWKNSNGETIGLNKTVRVAARTVPTGPGRTVDIGSWEGVVDRISVHINGGAFVHIRKTAGMTGTIAVPLDYCSPVDLAKRSEERKMARRAAKRAAQAPAEQPATPTPPGTDKPSRPRKKKGQNPCACGCGEMTGGTWRPGHNARKKS